MTATLVDVAGAAGVAHGVGFDHEAWSGVTVDAITHDSRAVAPGTLFCCVPGARADGHDFALQAAAAGAVALLVERRLAVDLPQLLVGDVRRAMGPAASAVYGHPSRQLTVIGVTGTNGKSSTVSLLAAIWEKAGQRAEVYGTLTGARTTPEAPDLQRQLRESRDRGVSVVAMEVSSHALELGRVGGTRFAAAVFTNLGRDHLDFHGDVESYYRAKARLFDAAYTDTAVVNLDDAHGRRLAGELAGAGITTHGYALADAEGLQADGPRWRFAWRGHPVTLQLAGRHNVSNALAAATTAAALGLDAAPVVAALEEARPVRGRFELVDGGQPFHVAVDYAHTPDALEAVITAGREVTAGRVIVLFGCGGDRDHDKRPEMGAVVDRLADVAVVTSDNPRSEDPDAIIAAVVSGMGPDPERVRVEPDRRRAVALALSLAAPGDLVLLAGKGHETTQVIGDRVLPFDDRAVALELLREARA
ncbi:MAG: UDP-N-acetylmuramoyl-L-alanyl-D-glutamate--2,6-diaminopimelate ligase [Acidimicrobiales bacterium]